MTKRPILTNTKDDDPEDDYDGPDEPECPRCRGDGRDPWTDYLMPCPLCEGSDL